MVRDDRNCSSRIYIDLYRGAHKIFIQELPQKNFHTSINVEDLQDLTQGPLWGGSQQHLQKIFSHGPVYKIMQKPLTAFDQDLHKSFAQGIVKYLEQDLHARATYL